MPRYSPLRDSAESYSSGRGMSTIQLVMPPYARQNVCKTDVAAAGRGAARPPKPAAWAIALANKVQPISAGECLTPYYYLVLRSVRIDVQLLAHHCEHGHHVSLAPRLDIVVLRRTARRHPPSPDRPIRRWGRSVLSDDLVPLFAHTLYHTYTNVSRLHPSRVLTFDIGTGRRSHGYQVAGMQCHYI